MNVVTANANEKKKESMYDLMNGLLTLSLNYACSNLIGFSVEFIQTIVMRHENVVTALFYILREFFSKCRLL